MWGTALLLPQVRTGVVDRLADLRCERGGRLRGRGDPEADGDGKRRHPFEPLYIPPDIVGPGDGRSGDAGDRDVIDESRYPPQDLPGPPEIGRRGDEGDEIESGRIRKSPKLFRLLGREVDDEEAVHAGGCGIRCEPLRAVTKDGVVVAEQNDRDSAEAAKPGDHRKDLLQSGPFFRITKIR